ncbi:MAG TPA: DJ-1/PfpI family protein [Candidatus Angelobacter sp.]|nr:DJ-1/PfpI family protein [Candidatus Angelobacter sp.]
MLKRIGILIFDDVEELDFVGPLEVFGMISCANQLEIMIIAETVHEVRCHYGLRVVPSHSLDQCPPLDLLIVPGGPGARKHARENPAILEFVRRQEGYLASVCTGALVLASAGVLKNENATTHHNRLEMLREYPGVKVERDVRLVIGDRVATSAGVSAGIDLSLSLLSRWWGEDVAQQVAENMEWESEAWRMATI